MKSDEEVFYEGCPKRRLPVSGIVETCEANVGTSMSRRKWWRNLRDSSNRSEAIFQPVEPHCSTYGTIGEWMGYKFGYTLKSRLSVDVPCAKEHVSQVGVQPKYILANSKGPTLAGALE